MASFKQYSASGGASEAFSIPSFTSDEIKVRVDGVLKTATTHYNITSYTTSGGTVTWTAGNAPSSGTVRIYRDTKILNNAGSDIEGKATYAAGSSVKAGDLNNNQKQALRALEEQDDQLIQTYDIEDSAITSAKIKDATIVAADIANDAIDSQHYAADSIDAEHYAPNSVDTTALGADAVTGAQLADNAVNTEHYTDNSIQHVHLQADIIDGDNIQDDVINSEHIAAGAVDLEHMSANSVDSDQYVDGSIDLAHMSANSVSTDQYVDNSIEHVHLKVDVIDGDNIQDDAVDSEHIAAGSIDTEHYSSNSIQHVHLQADVIDGDNIQDDVVNSEHIAAGALDTEHYSNNSIQHVHLQADIIDGDNIQDDVVNSEHIVADSLDTEHYAAASVDATALASNAVTEAKILDSNVTTAKLAADSVTIAKIGCEQTTISNSDSHIPTSGAVVDYVAAQIAPIGGLEVIADEDNFPSTQPAAGVVISIADAGGVVFNGSGVSTTARTAGNGSDNVTINGAPSSLYSETLAAGVGMQVSSTGSSHTYTYHKILAKEADVKQLSDDINDFNSRYRINAGEPSSNNDDGDLVWDTSADKMKVYDGTASAWKEVTSAGDFKYLFLCPAGGTGAPTLDGSIATYDLRESSNSGSAATVTSAAQLIVSVNGVIQKANTGTSAPAEGFALVDSNTIVFGSNLASGDSVFIVQIGSAVSIPTPGDGTVSTAKIVNGSVTTDKLAAGSVTEAKVGTGAITNAKLGTGAVSTVKISDGNVTLAKMASESVDEDNLYISNAGSNGQFLQKQSGNNGGLTWATVTDTNTNVLAGGTITGDVVFDNATHAGNDLTWDMSDNALEFSDHVSATFGDDLIIGHDLVNQTDVSVIASTSDLNISSNIVNLQDQNRVTRFVVDHANATLRLNDDVQLSLGTDRDMRFYHTGSHAYLNVVTGDLNIRTNSSESAIVCTANAGVATYYDTAKKTETTATGLEVTGGITTTTASTFVGDVTFDNGTNAGNDLVWDESDDSLNLKDNVKLKLGDSGDLAIYHDGSNSYLHESGTGDLIINSDSTVSINPNGGGEYGFRIHTNGACEAYYDNEKVFSTTASGVIVENTNGNGELTVRGSEGNGAQIYIHADDGDDNEDKWRINLAASDGALDIQNYGDGAWERAIECNHGGNVELYYDNALKLQTTSSGATVTGSVSTANTAKCWIKLNMSSGSALDSFNVSSVSDEGTGTFDVNFTTTITNEHAAAVAGVSTSALHAQIVYGSSDGNGFQFRCLDGGGSLADDPNCSLVIFDN